MKPILVIIATFIIYFADAQEIIKPYYKGGGQEIANLIGQARNEIKYNHCLMSTVSFSFNIDSLGKVDSIRVEEGEGTGGADILIEAIKRTSGNWQAETKEGHSINYRMSYIYFFNSVNKDNCENCKFWFDEGMKLYNQEKYKAAVKNFSKAIEYNIW